MASPSSSEDSAWGDVALDDLCADDENALQGDGDDSSTDAFEFAAVYRAVLAGKTVDELRAVIREVAKGSPDRRREAIDLKLRVRGRNYYGHQITRGDYWADESALQCAHATKRWELAGALVAAGADLSGVFGSGSNLTRLGACAAYGYVQGVRALLAAGHGARKATMDRGRTAAHAALACHAGPPTPEHLECVKVLVQQGRADLEAKDDDGNTVLLMLASWVQQHRVDESRTTAALTTLVKKLGADVNAANAKTGRTLLFSFANAVHLPALRRLIDEYGASADVVDSQGVTPLIEACANHYYCPYGGYGGRSPPRELVELLLSRSSDATRRLARQGDGKTAADLLLDTARKEIDLQALNGTIATAPAGLDRVPEWRRRAIAGLVEGSGVQVKERHRELAARIAERVAIERGEAGL